MPSGQHGPVLQHIERLLGAGQAHGQSDAELLQRFISHRDDAAFTALLQRHGPTVLGVCRRVLRSGPDIDDAFQATFLVLVRKAPSIVKQESLGSWLYGVAYRIAARARSTSARRPRQQHQMEDFPQRASDLSDDGGELRSLLDEELARLPEKYRAPLVLHYLEGMTMEQTARQLGWPSGTVSGRLARGRQLLRARLTRRGVAISGSAIALGLAESAAPAALPAMLLDAALKSAGAYLAGGAAATTISARAAELAEEIAGALSLTKLKLGVALALALGLLAGGGLAFFHLATQRETGAGSEKPPGARSRAGPPDVIAAPRPGADQQGDMLPRRVVVRLGTTRGRHGSNLSALAFTSDGRRFATRAGDGAVRVWDAASGRELHVFRGEPETRGASLWCFAFAPDGKTLATGGGDGMVRSWDLKTGRQLRALRGNPVGVRSLAFTSDGKVLAVAGEDNEVRLRDTATWKTIRGLCPPNPDKRIQATHLPVNEVAFSADDKTLELVRLPIGGFGNGYIQSTVELWDVATGRKRSQFRTTPFSRRWAFTPDGKAVIWMEQGGRVSLRALATGHTIRVFAGTDATSHSLTLDAAGCTLAVTSHDSVRAWDVATGVPGPPLKGTAGTACASLTRDGRTLLTGDHNGYFQVWDVASGTPRFKTFPGHRGLVSCVVYSPNGRTLATACAVDDSIRLWQASTGRQLQRWQGRGARFLAFTSDGKTLVSSGGTDRMVRFRDVATGKETHRFRAGEETKLYPNFVQHSPDGKLVAFAHSSGSVCLWTAAGKELYRLKISSGGPRPSVPWCLAFSADGKRLAASRQNAVHVWETATGREVRRLTSSDNEVTALAFSSDGRTLAAAGYTNLAAAGDKSTVSLWQIATGEERQIQVAATVSDRLDPLGTRLPQSGGAFTALVLAPGGKTLFGGRGQDDAIYVWDLSRDQPAYRAPGHKEGITYLAVAPDGKTLASASADDTVLVWDLARLVGG